MPVVPHPAPEIEDGAEPASPVATHPRRTGYPGCWAEGFSVSAVAVLLTVWANRSVLGGLSTTLGGDLGDPVYFAWQLAWVRHAVLTDPAALWTTPAFLRAPDNLAYTDAVLGYTPLGLLLPGGQLGAVTLLNLATLAAMALSIIGGYALARAMGGGALAGAVAGLAFGFAPWRITQTIHINVLSTGGIALCLALLARGNGWSLRDGWRPERMSWRWVAAGWAVACYQLTFGWALGIWFAYTVAIPMLLWSAGWLLLGRRRARLPRALLLAHGLGGAAFGATALLLLRPYLRVLAAHPEVHRGEDWLPLFSPPWRGLLTAPEQDLFWGPRQVVWRQTLTWLPEMAMSPGLILVGLALLGTVVSIWPWRRRLGLIVVSGVLAVLAMGTAFPLGHGRWTYLLLFRHLPGWSALRTPGRLMIWVTLCLALLAAGAVVAVYRAMHAFWAERGPQTVRRAGAVAAVVLVAAFPAAIVMEGRNTIPHWQVPTAPLALQVLRQPLLVLPATQIGDYQVMLWDTDGWPVLANGYSSFDPPVQAALRTEAAGFPDASSVAALRARGIRSVLLVPSRAAGTVWAQAAERPVTGLRITRSVLGDAVVYELSP